MDPREGRPPRFLKSVTDQSQLTAIFQFFQSSDMTLLLTAGCVAIGAMIVLCAVSGPAVTGVRSIATAMAFG
jgi:hypothetical protein